MLDTDTKRRIDTARDILVGKVPDPKSQVEQITIALIYKFMDDMDAESEELGGKRKFFTKEFARYGWAQLMRAGLGGHEMLGLYAEGITKMPENPGIPPLFRDIFKNAYLPYRDPETLKAFLKIIDEFSYDHSERLGDAFEYLLSVLGSQGDAGQFRTPRHIIDFMVAVVDPKKTDKMLDPACGTAGFLISSWKHILKANIDAKGNSKLTPDEKARLAQNFKGYDISPDMVRLSLVNLYLHGFTDPHVFEYDTLTSEERWNEFADVILANPPFMSPKGGIKPHKRFSIQAKRSEVLFVDYMAEHLTPTGRAGIIVPEGIIFQSQTAYKELRRMLVENSLVAVVSLPAGCFNPYSGVKTSILILDKSLAKAADTIAFFKVENDGFGLGAQRRAIDRNDLPQVKAELDAYLDALRSQQPTADLQPTCGLIVAKEKIAANGDYNLSGERYREGAVQSTHFPWRTVESLVETITPPAKIQKTAFGTAGRFPIIDQSQDDIAGWTDDEYVLVRPSKPLVIFGDHTCAVKLVETPFAQGADGIKILQTIDVLEPRFLFHALRARPLESDGYQRHYSKLKEHQIPLPPLEVQQEIVAEIEGYQKVINGARVVLDHYRPHIPIHPDWPIAQVDEVCSFTSGGTPSKTNESYWVGTIPWVSAKDLKVEQIFDAVMHVSDAAVSESATQIAPVGSVLILVRGMGLANGVPISEVMKPCAFNQDLKALIPNPAVIHGRFLAFALRQQEAQFRKVLETAAHGTLKLNSDDLRQILIPLPPLATQQIIVAEIEAEQALVAANRELIARFEKKIQTTLARVWGEDESHQTRDEEESLNLPTTKIVDLAAYRAAIGCYAISKMQGKRYFGRTAAMKVLYLAQVHVGLELGLKPLRDAAGPLDKWVYDFEKEGVRKDWFRVSESNVASSKKKIDYQPGRLLAEQSSQGERMLPIIQRKEFDRLLGLFADRTTEQAEIIATLFAAWNDFLIDGHIPDDNEIIREVRENWHEKKGRFTPAVLRQWLGWLHENKLIPKGRLPRTTHQSQLFQN